MSFISSLLSSFLCLRQLIDINSIVSKGASPIISPIDLYIALTNPLHHVNSTVMSFWAIWESNMLNNVFGDCIPSKPSIHQVHLYLIERYDKKSCFIETVSIPQLLNYLLDDDDGNYRISN